MNSQRQDLCKPTSRAVPGLNPSSCEKTIKEFFNKKKESYNCEKSKSVLLYKLIFVSDNIQELYTHEIDDYISLNLKLLYT